MRNIQRWTPRRLLAFTRKWAEADAKERTEFIFANREYVTGYAAYLVRHLLEVFG